MNKDRSQLINAIFIIIGGVILIFQLAGEDRSPYLLILGLVLLMFGLYRATNHWVYTKDDHKNEGEDNGLLEEDREGKDSKNH